MILSDGTLRKRLHEFIAEDADPSLINPASIDIRVGQVIKVEDGPGMWRDVDISARTYLMKPKEFVLVPTLEVLSVPIDCAVELKLKSSRAREGYQHSLAFWFDAGWYGVGTMEISNITRYTELPLRMGLRMGQIIIHTLDAPAEYPYRGSYQGAKSVESSKKNPNNPNQ